MTELKIFRKVALAEGVSFLVLLLIAMPLKYYFGMPMAVKVVGWAHGVLFMAYILLVFSVIKAMQWNWFNTLVALAVSLIPIGTFWLDKSLKKRQLELEAAGS
jgi:integral membrane protein